MVYVNRMTIIEQSYRGVTVKLSVLALALFVVGTNAFVIAGLLPAIARDLHTNVSAVSYSISSYSIVVAVAAPAISILLPRVPRSILMAAGLAVFAAGTALSVAATTLPLFFVGRTLSGLGGAALVPTATAAAAMLARPQQRGRALAIVGAGFTLAVAVGSPFGTALGEAFGWRSPLLCLVGLAVVLVAAILVFVRAVPSPASASFAQRLQPLRDLRILTLLGTTVFMIAGFNVVYIFSAVVTEPATGGSGGLLAVLLLSYGVAGVLGNLVAGPLTDRWGSRTVAIVSLVGEIIALLLLLVVGHSFPLTVGVFVLWGLTAFALTIPVQHRLVAVDPDAAALTLSWYSTAMYLGISIAPLLGGLAIGMGGAADIPIAGAAVTLIALALFLLGYRRACVFSRRSGARAARDSGRSFVR